LQQQTLNKTITEDIMRPEFGNAAPFYHEHATVQKETAERLLASLKPWQEILPQGPVIELGCGTGFVSCGLQKLFNHRKLIITDLSSSMAEACRQHLDKTENLSIQTLDAREVPVDEPTYAMSISSFAAQWFDDAAYTLGRWLEVTKPGGLLLAAFPGNQSFPEWKKHAQTLGIPFTGNPLPDTEEMVVKLSSDQTQVDYYEDTITQKFKGAANFFRHLKNIGAGRQLEGRPLNSREMKMLIEHWNAEAEGEIAVSWHVVFLAVKKSL